MGRSVMMVALTVGLLGGGSITASPQETVPRDVEEFASWLQKPSLQMRQITLAGGSGQYVEKRDTSRAYGRYGSRLAWVRLPLDRVHLRVEPLMIEDSINRLFERTAHPGTVAVLSGGFFHPNRAAAVGLVISDGRRINPREEKWREGGVLVQEGDRISIHPIRSFVEGERINQAVQSLPILVLNSRIDRINPRAECSARTGAGCAAHRTAVALRGREILLVVALGEFTTYQFAHFLAAPVAQGGLGVESALGLDGGPSTHLYIREEDLHVGGNRVTYVPNLLRFDLEDKQ